MEALFPSQRLLGTSMETLDPNPLNLPKYENLVILTEPVGLQTSVPVKNLQFSRFE